MLTIHVWPRWLKAFLLAHDLYKSPPPPLQKQGNPTNRSFSGGGWLGVRRPGSRGGGQMTPFEDGTPFSSGSIALAALSARAKLLNSPSQT